MVSVTEQRFAIVHADMGIGGAEKQSVILGALLRDRGAAVKVFGFSGPGPLTALCDRAQLPWEVLGIRWGGGRLRTALQLVKLARGLRAWRPTVLMPYCDIPNILCGASWRLTGARLCVWNQRGIDIFVQTSRLGQAVLRNSTCILSNSSYRADYLMQTYGVVSSRIHVVPNAVELPAEPIAAGAFRRELGIASDRFVCAMVANFVERKNHRLLLDAWQQLMSKRLSRQPVLVLVGRKEPYFEQLSPVIERLQREGAEIVAFDYRPDALQIVAASDLAVLTSTTEGLPNAALEAMLLEKAVVGVEDPSMLEALGNSDAVRRLLVGPDDARALADRIAWAIEQPVELAEVARANRERAVREFSSQALVQNTLNVLSPYLS